MAESNTSTTGTQIDSSEVRTTQKSSTSSKKNRKKRTPKKHILTQFTIRNPPWAYVHLEHLISPGAASELDAVTAQLHLTAALSQLLGLHGAAIAFDILKLEGQDLWIRLASEDRAALVAAAGGWVSKNGEGWRVKGWSSWDARATNMDAGQGLFKD